MATHTSDQIWDIPPLSQEDQRLVDCYVKIGKPLDRLAYSDEFEKLVDMFRGTSNNSLSEKYLLYQRLLQLRKQGRLPRLGSFIY
jgi:hypothetical protein